MRLEPSEMINWWENIAIFTFLGISMSSIFVYELANMARHRNILKNAKRQLKAQKEKQQEKKSSSAKSQKSIVTIASPQIVNTPQEINQPETALNVVFSLSSSTDAKTLSEHCLLLRQANDFISNQIKQAALEKYQIQQKIFQLTAQINSHLQKADS